MSTLTSIANELRPVSRSAQALYYGAAFWLTAALVDLVALATDSWTWSGAVSFRKPFTFSLSIGLLLATTGWILDRLPYRRFLSPLLAWAMLISSTGEVGLITLQAWRGRASHFNTLQAGDAAIFGAMGGLVAVMSLCLVTLLVWSIRRRPSDQLTATAIIAGLALVATGLGIGQWIIELGNEFVAQNGTVPDTVTYGGAGVAKFPHAVAFHGVQLFILAAVMLRLGSQPETTKRRILWLIVASYTAILVFASIQTITGNSPLSPDIWSLGLISSVVGVGLGFYLALEGLGHTVREGEEKRVPVA